MWSLFGTVSWSWCFNTKWFSIHVWSSSWWTSAFRSPVFRWLTMLSCQVWVLVLVFHHSCGTSSSCFVNAYPSFDVIQVVHAFRGIIMHQFLNGQFECEFTIPLFVWGLHQLALQDQLVTTLHGLHIGLYLYSRLWDLEEFLMFVVGLVFPWSRYYATFNSVVCLHLFQLTLSVPSSTDHSFQPVPSMTIVLFIVTTLPHQVGL